MNPPPIISAPIIPVSDDFATAPQLGPADLAEAARRGFRLILCNRPDREEPDQISAGSMAARAETLGLAFVHLPFVGVPGPGIVDRFCALRMDYPGPVLAYCRSGTRSIILWALAEARKGRPGAEILAMAQQAGYDLSAALSFVSPA